MSTNSEKYFGESTRGRSNNSSDYRRRSDTFKNNNDYLLPVRRVRDDVRVDRRVLSVLLGLGMADTPSPGLLSSSSPLPELRSHMRLVERYAQEIFQHMWDDMPPEKVIYSTEETILGLDGNEIKLFINNPSGPASSPLPCIYHLHGGGMCYTTAQDANYVRLREQLCVHANCIVIGVEFRNSAGMLGPHPFPCGLDDCISGLQWVHTHREQLRISTICMCGESGGGNLALAACLAARQRGLLHCIDRVYALCPVLSNVYHLSCNSPEFRALPSLTENNGISFRALGLALIARLYDPDYKNARNPLAWPYWVEETDLDGLPPHVISVNELDPLCSEGIEYYRKLNRAGVKARCRMLLGTTHAADVLFMHQYRELFLSTVADIKSFIYS